MQDASGARQVIGDKIRQSTNIMIAVSTDPSVDELSAALALALMLNKMDKHATAVFSGKVPPTLEFLNPGKTFEGTVDSLRDFIISLDKEKADRLRYKVENDVVRIFITPYRTPISEKDLQFSQGDFNVELIIALGVDKRDDLDKAIVAHGRILHDATVATINANAMRSSLGAIDWHEAGVSSLCEMLVSLSESFQQPGLLDQQIATALLTGIVAATDRFSNQLTNPKVMTMAAQLMAAGANQQLIATNLGKALAVAGTPSGQLTPGNTSIKVQIEEKPKKDGELDIVHKKKPLESKPKLDKPADVAKAEAELAAALPAVSGVPNALEQLKADLAKEQPKAEQPKASPFLQDKTHAEPGSTAVNMGEAEPESNQDESYLSSHGSWRGKDLQPPDLGGVLNATAERAHEDEIASSNRDRNKKILRHFEPQSAESAAPETPAEEPVIEPVAPAPVAPELPPAPEPEPPVAPPVVAPLPPAPMPEPVVEPASAPAAEPIVEPEPVAPAPVAEPQLPPPAPQPEPTPPAPEPSESQPQPPVAPQPVAEAPKAPELDLDAARQAVSEALASQPERRIATGALPLGSPNEPQPPLTPAQPVTTPLTAPDNTLAPLPPLPPMPQLPQADPGQPLPSPPQFDVPPMPPIEPLAPPVAPPAAEPTPPAVNDPAQFKIPGA